MSLSLHPNGAAARTSGAFPSSVSFLSSFSSTKTVQQPVIIRQTAPTPGTEYKAQSESPRTAAADLDRSPNLHASSGTLERPTPGNSFDGALPKAEQIATVRDNALEEALATKLGCSQQLLVESQQREKNLQYRLRQAEAELQVLRRSRPALMLRIGRQRLDPRTKSFVQYEVCVERVTGPAQVVQYSLWRRFSQFHDMHRQLAQQCPPDARVALPRIPPKRWKGNLEPDCIETRAKELHWYLQLISAVDPLRRCEAFVTFLVPSAGNGGLGGDVACGERTMFSSLSESIAMRSATDLS